MITPRYVAGVHHRYDPLIARPLSLGVGLGHSLDPEDAHRGHVDAAHLDVSRRSSAGGVCRCRPSPRARRRGECREPTLAQTTLSSNPRFRRSNRGPEPRDRWPTRNTRRCNRRRSRCTFPRGPQGETLARDDRGRVARDLVVWRKGEDAVSRQIHKRFRDTVVAGVHRLLRAGGARFPCHRGSPRVGWLPADSRGLRTPATHELKAHWSPRKSRGRAERVSRQARPRGRAITATGAGLDAVPARLSSPALRGVGPMHAAPSTTPTAAKPATRRPLNRMPDHECVEGGATPRWNVAAKVLDSCDEPEEQAS